MQYSEAAAALFARGKHPHVEIMIPLVATRRELEILRALVEGVLDPAAAILSAHKADKVAGSLAQARKSRH